MKSFEYIGPPNRLFYGPVTREVNPGDVVELPDDWEHHEWIPYVAKATAQTKSTDTATDSAKEQK